MENETLNALLTSLQENSHIAKDAKRLGFMAGAKAAANACSAIEHEILNRFSRQQKELEVLRSQLKTHAQPTFGKMNKSAAADLLNVSRPYIDKILESGELQSLSDEDVLAYKDKRDADRKTALDEISAICQDAGLYDLEDAVAVAFIPSYEI